jgi:SOS response regulatory protein OraA/RecX
LHEREANAQELALLRTQAEQHALRILEHRQKLSGKELAKLLDPDVQSSFKQSVTLVKQFKKNSISAQEFAKQFIKTKASFYEGQAR